MALSEAISASEEPKRAFQIGMAPLNKPTQFDTGKPKPPEDPKPNFGCIQR
jgi:hypothetical protein